MHVSRQFAKQFVYCHSGFIILNYFFSSFQLWREKGWSHERKSKQIKSWTSSFLRIHMRYSMLIRFSFFLHVDFTFILPLKLSFAHYFLCLQNRQSTCTTWRKKRNEEINKKSPRLHQANWNQRRPFRKIHRRRVYQKEARWRRSEIYYNISSSCWLVITLNQCYKFTSSQARREMMSVCYYNFEEENHSNKTCAQKHSFSSHSFSTFSFCCTRKFFVHGQGMGKGHSLDPFHRRN